LLTPGRYRAPDQTECDVPRWEHVQQDPSDEDDTGIMGHGMARQCMMEQGGHEWRKHAMMCHGGMMGPLAMRIIFALMDRDGDGTISLRSFKRLANESSKLMDADKDGTVSQEELLDFMRGLGKSAPQH
jgi:EF hand/EF-hand domain pair